MDLTRIENTLNSMNSFGSSDNGITRLAYSREEREAVGYFMKLCEQEGMKIRIDACGNVIARREGKYNNLPAVAIGSHLDTVYQGGKFDGIIGVLAGLEIVRDFNERGIETDYPIEIISFTCEESSRFGVSTIGSKAMVGSLKKESIANLVDKDGKSIIDAFTESDLDFNKIETATRDKMELRAFFELHIEQGPVLEAKKKSVGIVTGIAAPTRLEVRVQGKASHSGTTPLINRKDALVGASNIILEVERAAYAEAGQGTIATVSVINVTPGAMNVVPETAELKIDIRGVSENSKNNLLNRLIEFFKRVESERGLIIKWKFLSYEKPVLLDSKVIKSLTETCEELKISYIQMPSGAGHDAMNMAKLCPTGLIFVPSKEGLSHHKDEFTDIEAIGEGINLLKNELLKWTKLDDNMPNTMDEMLQKGESK